MLRRLNSPPLIVRESNLLSRFLCLYGFTLVIALFSPRQSYFDFYIPILEIEADWNEGVAGFL